VNWCTCGRPRGKLFERRSAAAPGAARAGGWTCESSAADMAATWRSRARQTHARRAGSRLCSTAAAHATLATSCACTARVGVRRSAADSSASSRGFRGARAAARRPRARPQTLRTKRRRRAPPQRARRAARGPAARRPKSSGLGVRASAATTSTIPSPLKRPAPAAPAATTASQRCTNSAGSSSARAKVSARSMRPTARGENAPAGVRRATPASAWKSRAPPRTPPRAPPHPRPQTPAPHRRRRRRRGRGGGCTRPARRRQAPARGAPRRARAPGSAPARAARAAPPPGAPERAAPRRAPPPPRAPRAPARRAGAARRRRRAPRRPAPRAAVRRPRALEPLRERQHELRRLACAAPARRRAVDPVQQRREPRRVRDRPQRLGEAGRVLPAGASLSPAGAWSPPERGAHRDAGPRGRAAPRPCRAPETCFAAASRQRPMHPLQHPCTIAVPLSTFRGIGSQPSADVPLLLGRARCSGRNPHAAERCKLPDAAPECEAPLSSIAAKERPPRREMGYARKDPLASAQGEGRASRHGSLENDPRTGLADRGASH